MFFCLFASNNRLTVLSLLNELFGIAFVSAATKRFCHKLCKWMCLCVCVCEIKDYTSKFVYVWTNPWRTHTKWKETKKNVDRDSRLFDFSSLATFYADFIVFFFCLSLICRCVRFQVNGMACLYIKYILYIYEYVLTNLKFNRINSFVSMKICYT